MDTLLTQTYLDWVVAHTPTAWWHDSADPDELDLGLRRGAIGVTTNPVLAAAAMKKNRERWGTEIDRVLARRLPPEAQAEALMEVVVVKAAETLLPAFRASNARAGFVCAQVNPARAGDRECMSPMAMRFHAWAPNIAVKLPATAAGLDVLEREPPAPGNPLLQMNNVILTPHVASASSRMDPARWRRVGQEIALVLRGKWPMSCVNPSVLDRTGLVRWQPYSMERGPGA